MFEAIVFVTTILFVNMMGLLFHIPELYVMIVNFVITLFTLALLWKLKAPFLPSSKDKVERMMKIAAIQKWDVVYELWSWDGRLLRAAHRYYPSKLVGYELSPTLVWYSRFLALVHKQQIVYKRADIFAQDFSDADVLFCFLLPQGMEKIMKDIRPTLKPWTRLISNIFTFKDIKANHIEWAVYLYIKE